MKEKETIHSFHFNIKSKIHGHLAHDKWPDDVIRWFIYSIEDIPYQKQIVGSTTNPADRWRNHKSTCNLRKSSLTGLAKHFKLGCPNDRGKEKSTLDFTLIDFLDTSMEKLTLAKHEPGVKCQCVECGKLKALEDFWILKLGTFHSENFNSRDEIKGKTRTNWK